MDHCKDSSFQDAQAEKSLLPVLETVILNRDCPALKEGFDPNEVDAMFS